MLNRLIPASLAAWKMLPSTSILTALVHSSSKANCGLKIKWLCYPKSINTNTTYGLLTKREVKMAGYWQSSSSFFLFLFSFLWTQTIYTLMRFGHVSTIERLQTATVFKKNTLKSGDSGQRKGRLFKNADVI